MGTFKVIIVLVCSVIALEKTNAKSIDTHLDLTPSPKNVADDLQSAIKELFTTIAYTDMASYNIVDGLIIFQREANKMLNATHNNVTGHFAKLSKTVEEFKEKGEEQGVNIEECIKNWNGNVTDKMVETKNLLQKSVSEFTGEHLIRFHRLSIYIITSHYRLEDYEFAASLCDTDDCLRKVFVKVKELEVYVTLDVFNIMITQLTEIRQNGETIIKECNSKVSTTLESMDQLTEDFKECAEDKLG